MLGQSSAGSHAFVFSVTVSLTQPLLQQHYDASTLPFAGGHAPIQTFSSFFLLEKIQFNAKQ
jgi:hypothetical protein